VVVCLLLLQADTHELREFTPSFLWLLRDFYLKLEDEAGRKVGAPGTPWHGQLSSSIDSSGGGGGGSFCTSSSSCRYSSSTGPGSAGAGHITTQRSTRQYTQQLQANLDMVLATVRMLSTYSSCRSTSTHMNQQYKPDQLHGTLLPNQAHA
jgi:hypothetical protein